VEKIDLSRAAGRLSPHLIPGGLTTYSRVLSSKANCPDRFYTVSTEVKVINSFNN
jgi:hypothetical protein